VLIVTISGNKWLADCGFGGPGLRSPLALITDQIQEQYGERYRLRQDPELGMVLQKETQNIFIDIYAFNENELTLDIDIDMANHFTSTWPASIFRLHRMCSLAHPWGRVTLSDMELAVYRDGQCVKCTLPAGPEYMASIAEHFGIDIDARYEDLAPLA
jgi:N-hydroxyarylamine O-acetyltransferase